MDSMQITILQDGTIKVETDKISAANHMTAEAFMRNISQVAGGPQTRKHRHGVLGAAVHAMQHVLGHNH
jgi:hypothetical protein